ncbi:MAG: hypothetical protein Q7S66_00840 [bacterium]|nr:hypothetical protein [bacterium]
MANIYHIYFEKHNKWLGYLAPSGLVGLGLLSQQSQLLNILPGLLGSAFIVFGVCYLLFLLRDTKRPLSILANGTITIDKKIFKKDQVEKITTHTGWQGRMHTTTYNFTINLKTGDQIIFQTFEQTKAGAIKNDFANAGYGVPNFTI